MKIVRSVRLDTVCRVKSFFNVIVFVSVIIENGTMEYMLYPWHAFVLSPLIHGPISKTFMSPNGGYSVPAMVVDIAMK